MRAHLLASLRASLVSQWVTFVSRLAVTVTATSALLSCAVSPGHSDSMIGKWYAESSKNTVEEYNSHHEVLTVNADGRFVIVTKVLGGPRDRRHPKPPKEFVGVVEGTWAFNAGQFIKHITHINGSPTTPSQPIRSVHHVYWIQADEIELRASPASIGQRLVRVPDN